MAAGLVVVTLALRFGPAVMLSLSLALPATEAWLSPVLAEPVREDIVT